MSCTVNIRVADMPEFQAFLERVQAFVSAYARHDRTCAAIDEDGGWRRGNPACTCGYDEDLAALVTNGEA